MYVLVNEAHLAPMQTMGTASGLEVEMTEDGPKILPTRVTFGVDHRPLRDMIAGMEIEGPIVADVEGWAVMNREPLGEDDLGEMVDMQGILDDLAMTESL
jgi:hypothetical protein